MQPGTGWSSAVDALPEDWDERGDASGQQVELLRTAAIRFASRRRAAPAERGELEEAGLPWQAGPPTTRYVEPPPLPDGDEGGAEGRPAGWPRGAPPPPLRAEDLWKRGPEVIREMETWVQRGQLALRATARRAAGEQVPEVEPPQTTVWRLEDMCGWAQPYDWDQSDPANVWPMHLRRPGDLREQLASDTSAEFFATWGERLAWTDADMLRQAGLEGVLSRSTMTRDTVFMYHHVGLRRTFQPAQELVRKEEEAGRVTAGARLPLIVPGRIVAYNCISQHKWKLVFDELKEVLKFRVTTDDSIEPEGCDARNPTIDRAEWTDPNLCRPQDLGEAVAIQQTVRPPGTLQEAAQVVLQAARQQGVCLPEAEVERIALWALDLSDAYRALAVHWRELWMQGFLWLDGLRLNLRCLFGTASMVGFFQRVSLFVLATAQTLMAEYAAAIPPSPRTVVWMERRGARQPGFQMMYLDDAMGSSILAPGERLHGAHRSSATLAGVESRAQAEQRLACQQFRRAGWRVQLPKLQLGFAIGALGIGVDTGDGPEGDGVGDLFCTEEKRQGLRAEALAVLPPRGMGASLRATHTTPRHVVETLVGRIGNLTQIEPAGREHMAPLYAVATATRQTARGREQPRRLHLLGDSQAQVAFREAAAWWAATLEEGLSVPLAPRMAFPRLGEPGVVAIWSDAAGERGTGIGAYAPVRLRGEGHPRLLYVEARWPDWAQRAFEANTLSMPAGEMAGTAAMVLAVRQRLEGVACVYAFTDCEPSQLAINSNASGSPQLHFVLQQMLTELGAAQILAIHQPGKRNWGADGLSRDGNGGATVAEVLRQAMAAGMVVEKLPFPETIWAALKGAQGKTQRANRSAIADGGK